MSAETIKYATSVQEVVDYLLDLEEAGDPEYDMLVHLVDAHDDRLDRCEENQQETVRILRCTGKLFRRKIDELEQRIKQLEQERGST